jgi:hypothetical protein
VAPIRHIELFPPINGGEILDFHGSEKVVAP